MTSFFCNDLDYDLSTINRKGSKTFLVSFNVQSPIPSVQPLYHWQESLHHLTFQDSPYISNKHVCSQNPLTLRHPSNLRSGRSIILRRNHHRADSNHRHQEHRQGSQQRPRRARQLQRVRPH